MKSIRVSLIVYFLSLLLLGLGGVSVLAYRTTAENLRDKEINGKHFLEADFEDNERQLRDEFDRKIHRNARLMVDTLRRPPYPWEFVSSAWHCKQSKRGFRASRRTWKTRRVRWAWDPPPRSRTCMRPSCVPAW